MDDEDNFIREFLSDFIKDIKINQSEYLSCGNGSNLTCDDQWNTSQDSSQRSIGSDVFTYVTPVIFAVGITGNTISLLVFLTKNMRKLSASVYLAALSTADIMALIFYVLVEWIRKGIPTGSGQVTAPFLESNGVCQIILFMSYSFRFLSAWLVVCFTLERYVGVCHPLKRKDVCNLRSSKRIVFFAVIVSFVIASIRPWLSEVRYVGPNNVPSCTRRLEHTHLSFIYDCIFGVCITFLPFLIITVLNTLIIRKLINRNKRHRQVKIITEESIIRLEFTIILITISLCFIAFNTPYAIVWFKHFLQMSSMRMEESIFVLKNQNLLIFTRTIFFMNYCINFFLYSITGAYFREELKMLFTYRSKVYQNYHKCPLPHSPATTPQSWIA
ncbi:thyrotropin-releasing hormone receptor-like [Mytilus californianus]|uniref:thyrotropin-releasing hormone receptor-like n=1 Tax=Mytilus californianus TaxID=6549 RepID=UPI00224600D5|nr:thyrotropin-releasing hormone receptor-like [Mytilus californianus]